MQKLSRSFAWILVCAVLSLDPGTAVAREAEWSKRYDALVETDEQSKGLSTHMRAQAITDSYAALFPPLSAAQLSRLSAADAAMGFRAANMANFYTQDERHLAQMQAYFLRLEVLGATSASQASDLMGAYVASRRWSEAEKLQARYPAADQEPLPSIRDTLGGKTDSGPSILTVDAVHGEVVRIPENVMKGAVIVDISHPLCHFSQAAAAAMASDPELAKLKDDIHWIAPVDRALHLQVLQQWNAQHPDMAMKIAYSRSQWPQLDNWGTPTFYFLLEGKLLGKVEGWPEEGRKAELLRAAHAIGL